MLSPQGNEGKVQSILLKPRLQMPGNNSMHTLPAKLIGLDGQIHHVSIQAARLCKLGKRHLHLRVMAKV